MTATEVFAIATSRPVIWITRCCCRWFSYERHIARNRLILSRREFSSRSPTLSRLHGTPLAFNLIQNNARVSAGVPGRKSPGQLGEERGMSSIADMEGIKDRTAASPWYEKSYIQVLIGISLGALVGYFWPDLGTSLKPLGDALIKMIKMAIAPIVFLTVVHGIASLDNMGKAGRIGLKAIIYFEAGTTVALLFGLLVVNLARPGAGMPVSPASLDSKLVESYLPQSHDQSIVGFLMNIIPQTFG